MKIGTPDDSVFYRNLNISFPIAKKAKGIYIFDENNKKYIDGVSGVCVVDIGHNVQEIKEAIIEQFEKICFCYHINFSNQPQAELAEFIIERSPEGFSKVFFLSGGSEATETAMKLAREYHLQRGKVTKYKVIGRWNSYHGNTMGALSMSGHRSRRKNYDPYLLNFGHIVPCYCYRCFCGKSYPNCSIDCAFELERLIKYEGEENISAFIGEPISATFGCKVPPIEYWQIIRKICDKYDILFIADEVITGFGRTGEQLCIQAWDVEPDLIATGKGISSGYTPLAAVLINEKVHSVFKKGTGQFVHSFTYIGNPLSCAIGLAVQKYVDANNLIEKTKNAGKYFGKKLKSLYKHDIVGDIDGKGLLWGIEFVADKKSRANFPRNLEISEKIVDKCFKSGLSILPTVGQADGRDGDSILLAPPFIISENELDEITDIIDHAIQTLQI